ncbi:hypothetical protein N8843_04540 [Verrucomicrobia bacterium]|nr:hypothetical protein [Verrucomicrobiota bacterium]
MGLPSIHFRLAQGQRYPASRAFTGPEEENGWYINAPAFEGVFAEVLHMSICIAT